MVNLSYGEANMALQLVAEPTATIWSKSDQIKTKTLFLSHFFRCFWAKDRPSISDSQRFTRHRVIAPAQNCLLAAEVWLSPRHMGRGLAGPRTRMGVSWDPWPR
jgi:hypothetical protein